MSPPFGSALNLVQHLQPQNQETKRVCAQAINLHAHDFSRLIWRLLIEARGNHEATKQNRFLHWIKGLTFFAMPADGNDQLLLMEPQPWTGTLWRHPNFEQPRDVEKRVFFF